jgi:hypothetical protein
MRYEPPKRELSIIIDTTSMGFTMKKSIRIGCGAGFANDRIDPAVKLAEEADLDYLVFECLAERTIALAQKRKLGDPKKGYDLLLEERMRKVLPHCGHNRTRIITNMGAANPMAAGNLVQSILEDMNLKELKVGVVLGDDVLELLKDNNFSDLRDPDKVLPFSDRVISANAYLGSSPIIELLKKDVDIIITGRTCDTSLFFAPMFHELKVQENELQKIGLGIAISHLLECGGQVTGGYFADPKLKDVADLANLGFPIAEVSDDLKGVITKLPGTGGEVSIRTCKEQLLYEVHDPSSYKTADGFSDFTKIHLEEIEKDRVGVSGGMGTKKPDIMKVIFGYGNGYLAEAQMAYGGEGAQSRARLAAKIILERTKMQKLEFEGLRLDFIGAGALWPSSVSSQEIVLRVAGRSNSKKDAELLCNEVEGLYTNGPYGGGGFRKHVEESISLVSSYIPSKIVKIKTTIIGEEDAH